MVHEHRGILRVVQRADLLEILRRRAGVICLEALLHEAARQLALGERTGGDHIGGAHARFAARAAFL